MRRSAGKKEKQDVRVTYTPGSGPLEIIVKSTVSDLFGAQIRKSAEEMLKELKITSGLLEVDDNQALDFVLRARIEAVV